MDVAFGGQLGLLLVEEMEKVSEDKEKAERALMDDWRTFINIKD